MKTRVPTVFKFLLVFFIAVAVLFGAYYLFDTVFDGAVLDWLQWNFVYTSFVEDSNGTPIPFETPDWQAVRNFLVFFIGGTFLIAISIILTVAYLYGKRVERRTVTQSSKMIHRYMMNDNLDAAEIFPRQFAEISTQMAEIKSEIGQKAQALKDESSRKNDLIAYLAHDLKTPLTSVIGYLSLLDEAPDMPPKQKARYVHISLEKALRLEQLINEFFDITRYNLQAIQLEKEPIDLSYMLIQMADEFYPILQRHGNSVHLDNDENLTIVADPAQLARVFNNILKNAVAYSDPNTPITISAHRQTGGVCIEFCNHGQTIPQQKLDAIFEKFFRLDDARTTNTGGAGLGLAIAKEIITLHGGTISATSKDGVTTFTVSLPSPALYDV